MRRRAFISLLGGAAAWSIASNAQPTERTRVVGVLEILGPDDPETKNTKRGLCTNTSAVGLGGWPRSQD